jgi:phosphohistidine phosphatase
MKLRLIIMRHAKSDRASGAESDHDRPLNARGKRDAPRMAQRLVEKGWQPDLVLCSSSRRTLDTWRRMSPKLDHHDVPLQLLDELYHAGPKQLREALARIADESKTVLALGHNPGWEDCVRWYTNFNVTLKTACAALLEIDAANWAEASQCQGLWNLEECICPKDED